jgi:uncharacterized membrane protein
MYYIMKEYLEKGKFILNVFTISIIILSSINGIKKYLELLLYKSRNDEKQMKYYELRIFLSESLVLALTFLLGAEIIETIIHPSIRSLVGVTMTFILRLVITFVIDRDINLLNVEKDELYKHKIENKK